MTEKFTIKERHGDGFVLSEEERVIDVPNNQLSSGVKDDEAGKLCLTTTPLAQGTTLQQAQQLCQQWSAFTLWVPDDEGKTWNNAVAILNDDSDITATQELRVHGHHVTPDYTRKMVLHKVDVPNVLVEVDDQ